VSHYGVFGETAILPVSFVTPLPDALSDAEGAALLTPYLTPWGALVDYGQMQSNDYVLITAATSSVGLPAIQIVKAAGAIAITTTRNQQKKQALLDAGADHVIVTNEENLVERVQAITQGRGARLIFDPIAGSSLIQLAEVAAVGANIFLYGALNSEATVLPLWTVMGKELNVRGYSVYEVYGNPERLERGLQYIKAGIDSNQFKPVVDRTFPFEQIADAHRYMESNQQMGRIVVTL
jgi:NADPH:quinone reductase